MGPHTEVLLIGLSLTLAYPVIIGATIIDTGNGEAMYQDKWQWPFVEGGPRTGLAALRVTVHLTPPHREEVTQELVLPI